MALNSSDFVNGTAANGSEVFNNIQGGVRVHEVYTGTGFNTSITDVSTDEQSYEFTAITASNLGNADYVIIKALVTARNKEATCEMKIQAKETGGAYSDSLAYTTISSGNSTTTDNILINLEWYHTLTAGQKSNGVQFKVFSKSTGADVGDIAIVTNVQTVLLNASG